MKIKWIAIAIWDNDQFYNEEIQLNCELNMYVKFYRGGKKSAKKMHNI